MRVPDFLDHVHDWIGVEFGVVPVGWNPIDWSPARRLSLTGTLPFLPVSVLVGWDVIEGQKFLDCSRYYRFWKGSLGGAYVIGLVTITSVVALVLSEKTAARQNRWN